MCDYSKGFKLCSCENEKIKFREQEFYRKVNGELVKIRNKKNENIPLIYVWKLFRYNGETNGEEMGKYILPSSNIGKGFDAEWIVLNLNDENCFDFEYVPEEGDNLIISENVTLGPYISFIYKEKNWTIDHYDPFSTEIEEKQNGKIKNVT